MLRGLGAPGSDDAVGIDACSPGEVTHALAHGWLPDEISHTGTNVSERDLDVLLAHPIRLNLDAVSQLERVGRRAPGRDRRASGSTPGPAPATPSTSRTPASARRSSAITADRLDDAIDAVRRHGLVVDTLHFHAGSGWLGDQLDGLRAGARRRDRGSSTACSTRAARSAR